MEIPDHERWNYVKKWDDPQFIEDTLYCLEALQIEYQFGVITGAEYIEQARFAVAES